MDTNDDDTFRGNTHAHSGGMPHKASIVTKQFSVKYSDATKRKVGKLGNPRIYVSSHSETVAPNPLVPRNGRPRDSHEIQIATK